MADVPLTDEGLMSAWDLGTCLDLDVIYHDHLKRCRDTADVLYRRGRANIVVENNGPLPWNMGSLFQGKEITEGSLEMAVGTSMGILTGYLLTGSALRTGEIAG